MGGKKRVGKHPLAFRQEAVARMRACASITALAEELGIERSLLYVWRRKLDPEAGLEERRTGPKGEAETRALRLEREVNQLKRALADKTVEVDFLAGAWQRVKARRSRNTGSGAETSTTKSGK